MGLTRDESEDVIQESFLRLVRHLVGGGKEDNLRSWIFRVAHNLSIDLYRADKRNLDSGETAQRILSERHDPAPNPEERYLQEEEFRRLDAAMSKLTAQQRRCILLRAQGLRYREIAQVLGIGVPTVCDLVHRAIVRLAGEL
jgi:RNA polymerase sigma-70 factor (ECF subfamily)